MYNRVLRNKIRRLGKNESIIVSSIDLYYSTFNRQLNQMVFKGNFGYDVMESILYGTWLMLFIFKLTHN